LSTRASESSLTSFATQAYDSVNDRYKIAVESTVNPSNLDVEFSSFVGTPGTGPPSKGVVLLGYDGTNLQRLKTTSDGKVVCKLG